MNSQIKKLLDQAGIPSSRERRGQMDTVGYAVENAVLDAVIRQSRQLAAPRQKELTQKFGWTDHTRLSAVICPHDDFYYAARLYHLALARVTAKRIILLGVSHKARLFGYHDKLVFDGFREWTTPLGAVPVSDLRERLLEGLPEKFYVQDSDCHALEHSLEGIVQFLHGLNPEIEIVPILVPAMVGSVLESVSESFAGVLAEIIQSEGLLPGRDIAVVISNDGVHYGDAGWGAGGGYAPFGTDLTGYKRAVDQDLAIMNETLAGAVTPEKIRDFFERCTDPADVSRYRVTWCGRFAIALGVSTLHRLAELTGTDPLTGVALDYGTSVSEVSLDLSDLEGLGVTAPNNLHHWVGYPAVGYSISY